MIKADTTLAEARALVLEARREGIECPCCGQFARTYKRKITGDMASFLIWLVRQRGEGREWSSVQGKRLRGGDYGKLTHWGLAERRPNGDPTKRTSGVWRPTEKGCAFATQPGIERVPSHLFIYNNKRVGRGDATVNIIEALGTRFNYEELMHGH